MDDRIRREVSEFVMGLSTSQQEKLAAAGTLIDIEKLTAEIGDEVARQLTNLELSRRSDALCEQPTRACPDCGKECRIEPDLEPIILQGMRGEIEYAEPRCHCSRCRRDFFPLAGRLGRPPRENVTPKTLAKIVWAASTPRSLRPTVKVRPEGALERRQSRLTLSGVASWMPRDNAAMPQIIQTRSSFQKTTDVSGRMSRMNPKNEGCTPELDESSQPLKEQRFASESEDLKRVSNGI